MTIYSRGSTILIEVILQKKDPFGQYANFDPDSATITIYQSGKAPKINQEGLDKKATGQYFYLCPTDDTWAAGEWRVKIIIQFGGITTIKDRLQLKLH